MPKSADAIFNSLGSREIISVFWVYRRCNAIDEVEELCSKFRPR